MKKVNQIIQEYDQAQPSFPTPLDSQNVLSPLNIRNNFGEIADTYRTLLLFIAFRVLENYHAAEDVVQDALLKAYIDLINASANKLQDLHLRAWLCTIVWRTAYNYRLREKRFTFFDERGSWLLEQESCRFDQPDLQIVRDEISSELGTALRHLPNFYQQIIVLRFVGDCTYAQIAQQLGYPVGTIKCYHHRALNQLRHVIRNNKLGQSDLYALADKGDIERCLLSAGTPI